MEPSNNLMSTLAFFFPYLPLKDREKLKQINKLIYQCVNNHFQYQQHYLNLVEKDFFEFRRILTNYEDAVVIAKKSPEKAFAIYSSKYKELIPLREFLKLQIDINEIENQKHTFTWMGAGSRTKKDKNFDLDILNHLRNQFKLLDQISETTQRELSRLYIDAKSNNPQKMDIKPVKEIVRKRLLHNLLLNRFPTKDDDEKQALGKYIREIVS